MLPAETAEMRKDLLTLDLAKPRKNTKAILKKKKKKKKTFFFKNFGSCFNRKII